VIVISGALVVVAIVLLIIGLFSGDLPYIYASIAGSVVAFAFLIVGVVQRRGEDVPQLAGEPEVSTSSDVEGVTAIIPAGSRPRTDGASTADASGPAVSGMVLVVEGRPRYHVAGCRYLTGKQAEEVPVGSARGDGFTACGVCKPDEALAASSQPETAPEPVAAARQTAKAPARTAAAAKKAPATAAKKTAAPNTAVKKAAAKAAPVKKAAAKTAAAKTAAKAPAKTAAKKTAAKAPAKKAPAKKATTRR
jgi:hypothetical protein